MYTHKSKAVRLEEATLGIRSLLLLILYYIIILYFFFALLLAAVLSMFAMKSDVCMCEVAKGHRIII